MQYAELIFGKAQGEGYFHTRTYTTFRNFSIYTS
jgi:hypothetical protein